MVSLPLLAALLLQVDGAAVATLPRLPLPRAVANAPMATINDNRAAAGRRVGDTLIVALDIVDAAWRPEGETESTVPILAFAEPGKAPSVPSPLLRAPVGTIVRLTLTSRIDSALVIGGLRPGAKLATDTVQLAARGTRTITYRLSSVGSYFYWGAMKGVDYWENRNWLDSQLTGALIVDPPGRVVADRIFVITEWFYPLEDRPFEDALVFNGKAWPNTERLTLTQGDSVHWRFLNAAAVEHPLHLHGFYFRATRLGSWSADSAVPLARQRLANVQLIPIGGTMSMSFVPTQPGNWVFHCHFADHVGAAVTLAGIPRDSSEIGMATHVSHGGPSATAPMVHQMRGLVLGIHVNPAPNYVAHDPTTTPRTLRLFAQKEPLKLKGGQPAYGFALQKGDSAPAIDKVSIPAPLLELNRGQPVRIVVVNNLDEATGVHWHGLEIESFPDGVPAWSGMGSKVMPPIMPRDSFVAEFTPPRAGTFLYHAHSDELKQIGSGMYGALLVIDAPRDTTRDHVIIAGGGGPPVYSKELTVYGLVNGRRGPPPMQLAPGVPNRLRLVSIDPMNAVVFSIVSDDAVGRWRAIAKDGADLPPALRISSTARITLGPGETSDFEWTPPPNGAWRLEVHAEAPGWFVQMPFTTKKPE